MQRALVMSVKERMCLHHCFLTALVGCAGITANNLNAGIWMIYLASSKFTSWLRMRVKIRKIQRHSHCVSVLLFLIKKIQSSCMCIRKHDVTTHHAFVITGSLKIVVKPWCMLCCVFASLTFWCCMYRYVCMKWRDRKGIEILILMPLLYRSCVYSAAFLSHVVMPELYAQRDCVV